MLLHKRTYILSAALIGFMAVFSLARADDRFTVAVGAPDKLIILSAKGDPAAELSAPAIGRPVTTDGISFQVSYGRDANGQFTAVLSPAANNPADLHFTVLGKNVDAEKAIVTMTFSADGKSVVIDPGYVGSVEVDSQRLEQNHLADETTAPQPAFRAPTDSTGPAAATVFPNAPATLASQQAPVLVTKSESNSSGGQAGVMTADVELKQELIPFHTNSATPF